MFVTQHDSYRIFITIHVLHVVNILFFFSGRNKRERSGKAKDACCTDRSFFEGDASIATKFGISVSRKEQIHASRAVASVTTDWVVYLFFFRPIASFGSRSAGCVIVLCTCLIFFCLSKRAGNIHANQLRRPGESRLADVSIGEERFVRRRETGSGLI